MLQTGMGDSVGVCSLAASCGQGPSPFVSTACRYKVCLFNEQPPSTAFEMNGFVRPLSDAITKHYIRVCWESWRAGETLFFLRLESGGGIPAEHPCIAVKVRARLEVHTGSSPSGLPES